MNKKIAIILINYKDYAERFLFDCRDSLRTQSYPKELFNVYIIDNASTYESENYLRENFSEAIIIPRSDGNYSAGNNLGVQRAKEDGSSYFIIANMDVTFDKDWLKELVLAIESDDKIGIAQSKILLYPKDKDYRSAKINSLGNIINFLGFGFTSEYGNDNKEIDGYEEIGGYASGCSFIIKKEVFDRIGGYNEELFMYHDDLEIGWKVRLAGYKIILAPKSVVYHKYEFSRSIGMLYFMERNRYIVLFSLYKTSTIILIMPALILMDLGMLFYSLINGWFRIKLKVYGYFFKSSSWIKILEQRKIIKKIRIVKEKNIVKNISGKISFQEINNPILIYIANPLFNFYWIIIRKIINFLKT